MIRPPYGRRALETKENSQRRLQRTQQCLELLPRRYSVNRDGKYRKAKGMKTSHTTDWPCSAYEKPTPMGWSTKKTLALLFHDFLKNVGSSVALVIRQGPKFQIYAVAKIERIRMPVPSSIKSPRDEEQPGPKIKLSV
jgi:hypothetical protein